MPRRPVHPGEIPTEARAAIRRLLREALADDAEIDRWFGRYVTEPRRGLYAFPPDDDYTPEEVREALGAGARLRRSAVAAFAFFDDPAGGARLFAGGAEYALHPDLAWAAPLLTGPAPLTASNLADALTDDDFAALLAELVNEGHLSVER